MTLGLPSAKERAPSCSSNRKTLRIYSCSTESGGKLGKSRAIVTSLCLDFRGLGMNGSP